MNLPQPVRLGAQRPRVHSGPQFTSSAGREATQLAAAFGLHLDDWQSWVLDQSLGERSDGKWAAQQVGLLVPRQNGKGSVLEARELAGLFLFGEKKMTHSAHEAKTAKDHFERMESLLRDAGYDDSKVRYRRSTTEVSIEVLSTGCKLMFFTRTADGGRGLGGDVVVLDEAYALTRDQMAALMPTMAARSVTGNTQMWYTSSAGFDHSEVLADVRKDGEAGRNGLAYFDWSAPKGSDPMDRQWWAVANPGLGVRISEDFIESEMTPLGPERFARERLGIWADPGNQAVFSEVMVDGVKDSVSRVSDETRLVFAIDAEWDRSSAAISVAGYNAAGKIHLELVDQKPGIPWAADRMIEICQKRKPLAVVIDAGGPASSLIPVLQAAGITVRVIATDDVKKACGGIYDAVVEKTVAHNGLEQRFTEAFLAVAKRPIGDGFGWKRKDASTAIAPWGAATFAHYGLLDHAAQPKPKQLSTLYAF